MIYSHTLQRCDLPVFFPHGFITAIVVNPPERKLAKHTSVHWVACKLSYSCKKNLNLYSLTLVFDCKARIKHINNVTLILVKVQGRVLIENPSRDFWLLYCNSIERNSHNLFLREAYFLVFGILEKLLIVLKTDTFKLYTHSLGLLLTLDCPDNIASLKTKQSKSYTSFSSIHSLQ